MAIVSITLSSNLPLKYTLMYLLKYINKTGLAPKTISLGHQNSQLLLTQPYGTQLALHFSTDCSVRENARVLPNFRRNIMFCLNSTSVFVNYNTQPNTNWHTLVSMYYSPLVSVTLIQHKTRDKWQDSTVLWFIHVWAKAIFHTSLKQSASIIGPTSL